jgi:hypothetical protein
MAGHSFWRLCWVPSAQKPTNTWSWHCYHPTVQGRKPRSREAWSLSQGARTSSWQTRGHCPDTSHSPQSLDFQQGTALFKVCHSPVAQTGEPVMESTCPSFTVTHETSERTQIHGESPLQLQCFPRHASATEIYLQGMGFQGASFENSFPLSLDHGSGKDGAW